MLRTYNRMLLVCVVFKYSIAKSSLRVYGGSDANPDEYPYVVRLELQINVETGNSTIIVVKHMHICTASAITDTWVLTAAHCLNSFERLNAKLMIRYGHVLHSPWTKNSFSDVLLMITHPSYTYGTKGMKITSQRNDIALMKTTPIKIRTYMKLSAVDYLNFYGQEAIVAGFGVTSKIAADGTIVTNSTLDLKLPLQVLDVLITKCSTVYNVLEPGLCLTAKCGSTVSACNGDSGGPLIHPSGQVGIMSMGEATSVCSLPTKRRRPFIVGTVLPISPYIEWIISYVSL